MNAIPKTTRAAVYENGGRVVVRDVALQPPARGELLVRVSACGLCASEALAWYADSKAPFVLGHEPVAEIVACGEGASPAEGAPFVAGERVFVHHHAPCMTCRRCHRGDYVQCTTWRSTRLNPGALAQFATVPADNVRHDVLRIPPQVSDDQATLVEPLATVVKSVRRSGLRKDDRVLVLGLGAMGMLHALVARERGAALIIGADRVKSRLDRAKQFGIGVAMDVDVAPLRDQVHAATAGEGAEIVFVTPGSRAALEAAATCVAPGGSIVAFTPLAPGEAWPVDVNDLFFKDVSIVMSYSAGPNDTREALELLSSGLPVEPLFTHRFGLDQAAAAYAMVKNPEAGLKVIVYPNQ
ncbi:MAG: zinc-binding dehydrogenase [Candidatus Eremiobacteraeota bacterium]|nr:zinc-binding dehydrogenase [Candidatus Eremiobacteraeota bacterium]